MGGGSYDHEAHRALTAARASRPTEEVFTQRDIHPDMNPHGVAFRESRDSANHPESLGIIFALDETGSMGTIPEMLARQELPNFMQVTLEVTPHPQIMFMGIGDAEQSYRERAPLQVGQFESEAGLMDKWLTAIYLENKGGGNAGESYDLGWYFGARHTVMDCYEKRGQRGYFFMTGDEPHFGRVSAHVVKRVCGDTIRKDIPMADLIAEVGQTFHPFFLIPDLSRRRRCEDSWRSVLGDSVICLEDPVDTCYVAASLIGVTEGTMADLDAVGRKLKDLKRPRDQINRIIRAIEPYAVVIGSGGEQRPTEAAGRPRRPRRQR